MGERIEREGAGERVRKSEKVRGGEEERLT